MCRNTFGLPAIARNDWNGDHDVDVNPVHGGFEIWFHLGWTPNALPFQTEPEHDPIDHDFFVSRYDVASRMEFFNDSVMIQRRFTDSIVTVGGGQKLVLTLEGLMKTELTNTQRDEVLIEELGLSPEIVAMIPPDVEEGIAPF